MSELVGRIEAAIKQKGLTFNRVERDCGLGNGTIKRWGEQSPRLDKLMIVAEYLDVSLDYLSFGALRTESTPNGEHLVDRDRLTCDGVPLSAMENDLVAMLRLLPDDARKEIFDLVHFKYTRLTGGEKESIYWTYFDESDDEKSGPAQGLKAQGGTA